MTSNYKNHLPENFKDLVVVLGFFDGIHKGHQELLNSAFHFQSQNPSYETSLLTFQIPPKSFLQDKKEESLFSAEEREFIFKESGINHVFMIPPDKNFFLLKAQEFLSLLLKQNKKIHLVLGEDSKFGSDQQGGISFLEKISREFPQKFSYSLLPVKNHLDKKISSRDLREFLAQGKIDKVNELLTHPIFLKGPVLKGDQKGRTIGFPTLNVPYDKTKVVPVFGVYESETLIKDKKYKSLTYISDFKMDINLNSILSETWVLNFNEEIYGETVRVYLKEFKRPPIKVDSFEELKKLLEKDKFTISNS